LSDAARTIICRGSREVACGDWSSWLSTPGCQRQRTRSR
jgi:hypothetical protein